MSEVLVLRPGEFTGFDNTSVLNPSGFPHVAYYSGNADRHVYVMRATISATATTRTIESVTARLVGSTGQQYEQVVCQISTGANDFINTVGASGSEVGRSVKTVVTGSGYTPIGNGFGGYTISFNFSSPITLAKNTTYYLWFYPNASGSASGIGLSVPESSMGSMYWSTAGVTLNGTEVSTPISVSVSATPYNTNTTISGWGLYVQNYSRADITVTATGTNDSAITKCVVTLGSTTVWNSASLSGRSDIIRVSGSAVPINVTVTDALGMTATASISITVHAYQSPNLTNITCSRCDASGTASTSGTYLYFSGTPTYSDVNYQNSCTVSFKYGPTSGSMGSYTTISNPATWQRIASGLSATTSYLVVFRVVDTIGNAREFSITIPSDLVTMNFKEGGTGVCFGSYADKDNCFEISNAQGWKAVISNGMYGDSLPSSGVEGQIYLKRVTTPSGSASLDYAMYNSVTDVGLTSGSATIVAAAAAMPMNSYLICPANEFDSTSVPSLYGHIEILIPGAVTRMSILFRGKEASIGDYRMFVNSSGVPDGTWHKITMS